MYCATTLFDPTGNEATFSVTLPVLSRAPLATTGPSAKITEPDGVPPAENFGCTVAVSVTDWKMAEGLSDEARVSVLAPWFTKTLISFPPGSVAARSRATVLVNEPEASTSEPKGT